MRLTMKNHGSHTYRDSLIRVDNNCALRDIVDKFGKPEEFEQLKCEHEKRTRHQKQGS